MAGDLSALQFAGRCGAAVADNFWKCELAGHVSCLLQMTGTVCYITDVGQLWQMLISSGSSRQSRQMDIFVLTCSS